jgi:exopolysaccharide biosynthesis predicted pyruvyltransferase EpsI
MDSFERFLENNKEKRTILVTPGGNHGDTLIHMGHVKKLEELQFDYTCFNLEKHYKRNLRLGVKYLVNILLWKYGSKAGFRIIDVPKDVELILFEGGGYVNDIWYGPALLNQVLKHNKQPVAVAPQSYRFKKASIETYINTRRLYLFCREKASYEFLNKMQLNENTIVEISPEVALYLTKEDLIPYVKKIEKRYQLVAFRRDKESAMRNKIKRDVLDQCSNPIQRDVSVKGSFSEFVSIVENAEMIFTDRLHVAILGSILGKKVTLFGNKYHKNSGVWEYSLKDMVTFISV